MTQAGVVIKRIVNQGKRPYPEIQLHPVGTEPRGDDELVCKAYQGKNYSLFDDDGESLDGLIDTVHLM